MKGTAAYYSTDLKIKDTRFSIDYLQDYILLLQAGEREFQLAVIDTKTHRCLLLEHYNFFNVRNKEEYQQLIEALFEDHHLLMAGFWHSVRFAIKNLQFSLIPAALFDKEQLPAYLRLTSALQQEDVSLFYPHAKNSIVTVFAAEQQLLGWLNKRYANLRIKVLHHISAFVEGVLNYPNPGSEPAVFLLLEQGVLTVVISHQSKLLYANLFRCKSSADVLRYLMLLFREFGLSQATTRVLVWGNITATSSWYQEIKPYFGNLTFGTRPRALKFNYMFDEVPEQRFFDLFSLARCE